MMQRGEKKKKLFHHRLRAAIFLLDANLLKQQQMTAYGLLSYKQVQVSSSETNCDQATIFFSSLQFLPPSSFREFLVSFRRQPFYSTSVSLCCF